MSNNNNNTEKPYRPCVGIVLFNEKGQVFAGSRIDTEGDSWQMPQGGIDEGETVEEAAFRELMEEVGTDKAEIIGTHPAKIRYDLPEHLQGRLWEGRFAGQEQNWVAMRFYGTDQDIDLNAYSDPEFDDWQWLPLEDIVHHAVPFKRDVYKEVISFFISYAMMFEES